MENEMSDLSKLLDELNAHLTELEKDMAARFEVSAGVPLPGDDGARLHFGKLDREWRLFVTRPTAAPGTAEVKWSSLVREPIHVRLAAVQHLCMLIPKLHEQQDSTIQSVRAAIEMVDVQHKRLIR